MKKFLSVILTLAMLVAPIGVMSCFADGGIDTKATVDLENADLDTILINVILDIAGRYKANFEFFGEGQKFLRTINIPEGMHLKMIENMIDQLRVKEKMIETGSCKVLIMIESHIKGCRHTILTFFNLEDRIVKIIARTDNINEE